MRNTIIGFIAGVLVTVVSTAGADDRSLQEQRVLQALGRIAGRWRRPKAHTPSVATTCPASGRRPWHASLCALLRLAAHRIALGSCLLCASFPTRFEVHVA